ncbi:MAG TPA: DUF5995 family protein [Actinomycetes bacterium]|nr:DUF5995 family protein [Actinomycetes bacterium]
MSDLEAIDGLVARMEALLEPLQARGDARRFFHGTYLRTTRAVGAELRAGGFLDAPWVERWDVAFANLYLDALEADQRGEVPSEPWRVAFAAAGDRATTLPPLRHVLLGMNAHINYDLPQALLAVIDDQEFQDSELLARRSADHGHIDTVLAARVGAEDVELGAVSRPRSLLDRLLTPANRLGTRRFLEESRAKVWANARALALARRQDPDAYTVLLAELERLAARRVADLTGPGQVILKLAVKGFGVVLAGARPAQGTA